MMGAEELGIDAIPFENGDVIPTSPYCIIVGCVEVCEKWLERAGFPIPPPIPLELFNDRTGRSVVTRHMDDIPTLLNNGPVFIKPATRTKAFTGFVVTDLLSLQTWTEGYNGDVLVQPVMDIVSEYRMYISNDKIIDVKHYAGDPLIFPSSDFLRATYKDAIRQLSYHSYTLDFGVLDTGETILIEANDGWAIGNYGLHPKEYYLFVRNRWLQMTGLRTRKECF